MLQKIQQAADSARAHSPFLSRLLTIHPQILEGISERGVDNVYSEFCQEMVQISAAEFEQPALMRELRLAKGKIALLTALADIAEIWSLEQVTNALSDFAENCLQITVNHLLTTANKRGEIAFSSPLANYELRTTDYGFIVLGMGKLGGRELNYSSDIDLILLYEPSKIGYHGKRTEQHFMNKLAHDLVAIMQDRTADGYVFRTDLRLRPDPASTPPVVTIDAAYYYYEGVGQNWERAAMIKARPLAGDIAAGARFLKSLTPFMWRRNLDFAAINDIHSIKRQMDSRESKEIKLAGHNVKLGLGGIREIEFYAQIHQLIWGGREPTLRLRVTCDTLNILTILGLIDEEKNAVMQCAYRYLRKLEHRIQMVADAQTHSLPDDEMGLKNIAEFMGYATISEFEKTTISHLRAVHDIYANSFRSAEKLGDSGNLVFTGVSHDEETLKTLREMGYTQPEVISEIVMGWHHGSRRATRTKRARELITEMMPSMLKRLSETANPDAAFLKFNEFLQNLPAAVQIFSLFQMNPHLLGLIADIMGSAPTLAETLSHNPELLEAVLYEDFYSGLPSPAHLQVQIKEKLIGAEDFEELMDRLREFRNEKRFQAGVQLLKNMIDAHKANEFLSDLADIMVNAALNAALREFEKTYGKIAGSRFAIIALGKLGSREMTFSSDIDLVFVYDTPDFDALSNGEKQFTASVYYNRFAQRLLNALSAIGRGGRLYEVDTRLRPSGKQGLLAVSVKALNHYFEELAWTFEYMAFTKARAVAGDDSMINDLENFVNQQIAKPRDAEKLRLDVADMRERMAKEFPSDNPWDIKNIRGGLTDIDFIAQYLILLHAPSMVGVASGSANDIFQTLERAGMIEKNLANELVAANKFLGSLFNILRLCSEKIFDEETALEGLKTILVKNSGEATFSALKEKLLATEAMVYKRYQEIIG